MTRSLGDQVASSVGVTHEPEILEYTVTPDDKFLVLASDGVFEHVANEDVLRTVVPYWKTGNVNGACQALTELARTRWLAKGPAIDDITAIVVFLN
jgi:serine/threonine protein phosphatase PrpC